MSDSLSTGRRGVNVTAYLRGLEAAQLAAPEESFSMEDLEIFTNTRFFDFDSGQNTDFQPHPAKTTANALPTASPSVLSSPQLPNSASTPIPADFLSGLSDFSFPTDLTTAYPVPQIATFPGGLGQIHAASTLSQPPTTPALLHRTTPTPTPTSTYTASASSPQAGDKRKATEAFGTPALSSEDQARVAAEEDKRRRNTAASARFRVKKKQREQALEKSAKELADKNSALEQRVQQLETECKWLRSLLIEKTGDNNVDFGKLLKAVVANQAGERPETLDKQKSDSLNTEKKGAADVKEENAR